MVQDSSNNNIVPWALDIYTELKCNEEESGEGKYS